MLEFSILPFLNNELKKYNPQVWHINHRVWTTYFSSWMVRVENNILLYDYIKWKKNSTF